MACSNGSSGQRTLALESGITLEPGKLLNSDGNFCLEQKTTNDLLKYLWTACMLPTNMADFKFRIGVSEDLEDSLVPMVQTLLGTYTNISQLCTTFKDDTYVSIVHLADDVYNYAQTAGLTTDLSYYANMVSWYLQLVEELAKPHPDPATVATLQTGIKQLIAAEVASIDILRAKAASATQALRDFDDMSRRQQQDLGTSLTAFQDKLNPVSGEIARLQADLKQNQDDLASAQSEYDEDIVKACTAATYAWIWPFGTIAAGVVMGVYGADAVKMEAKMAGFSSNIDNDNNKIQADQHLMADIALINTSLQSVIDLIGPAITSIEDMMGYYDSVTSDLQAIETFVETNSATGPAIVQRLNQAHIVAMWNTLADSVDKYRKAAFRSDSPKPTSFAEWKNEASNAAKTFARLNLPAKSAHTVKFVQMVLGAAPVKAY